MKNIIKAGATFAIFALIIPVTAFANCSEQVARTVTYGMKGNDVKIIQKFLNDNPTTVISKTGVNSKGKESGIFDKATLKAFKIFQSKNAEIILKPAGLKVANGIVGKNARNIINQALCNDEENTSTVATGEVNDISIVEYEKSINDIQNRLRALDKNISSSPFGQSSELVKRIDALKSKVDSFFGNGITMNKIAKEISKELPKNTATTSKDVSIEAILPLIPEAGEKIFIFGTNFAAVNKIYIGNKSVNGTIIDKEDAFITATLPTDLADGSYDLYIENVKGKSPKTKIQIAKNISGKSSLKSASTITSITPKSGNVGTAVVLAGDSFTKKNTIHTTTKSYIDVPSLDGKTLKFTIDSEPSLLNPNGKLMTTLPFTIFVRNENGDSNVINFKLE